MNKAITDALKAWDFEHGRVRDMPKVYLDGRWHNQCRCGKLSLTHAEHDAHRFAELESIITNMLEKQKLQISQNISTRGRQEYNAETDGTLRCTHSSAYLTASLIALHETE